MASQLFYLPFRPALDMNGFIIAGAKAYFYLTGTNTFAPVYSESTLTTLLPNPVVADAAGRWPSIYLNDALTYRLIIKDSTDTTIPGFDVDPYYPELGGYGVPSGGTTGQVLKKASNTNYAVTWGSSVTSVGLSAPTGLTVTGSPVTTSGTLALSFTAGYSIPTTAKQTDWDTAFTDRNKWDGGATGLTASTGRTSLGATTLGANVFTIANPGAITFPRFNADNTVSALSAADFRTAIGAGAGTGTVTTVSVTTANGVSGTVANPTTTPAITLSLGAITPTSVTSTGVVEGSSLLGDYVQFDTIATVTPATGRLYWNDGEGNLSYLLKGGNVTQETASTQNVLVYNGTGSPLTKGQVVYMNGAQGQRPSVALALATSDATSARTLGVVAEAIANGAEGWVTSLGILENMDTSAFTAGAQLYLSGSTAGALTQTKPQAPVHMVYVARCIKSHATSGRVFVTVQNGYEMDELHDVKITSPVAGNILIYDDTQDLWVNNTLTAGSNITITNADGAVTINSTGGGGGGSGTVTSVDVSGASTGLTFTGGPITTSGTITMGGTLAVASGGTGATSAASALSNLGAYAASNPAGYTSNVGTVTSVAATAGTGISISGSPITGSGTLTITNTAPDQTVTLTAGSNVTITGTYPSFTIASSGGGGGTVGLQDSFMLMGA